MQLTAIDALVDIIHYNRPTKRTILMSANRTSSFATVHFGDTGEVRFAENDQ